MSRQSERDLQLKPFGTAWAETILAWITTPQELRWWSARQDFPLTDPAVFDTWQADPQIAPHVLLRGDAPLAYGEVWFDDADRTAELARVIVSPRHRRQGHARALIERLSAVVQKAGYGDVFVRVFPDNIPAIRCYRAAGFARVSPAQEQSWNRGQRFDFIWMVLSRST
jgi:ribosomal protein S18 acetylase RimI-like enzyme